MKNKLLVFLLILCSLQSVFGQTNTLNNDIPEQLNYALESPYIFEASVVRGKSEGLYHNDHVQVITLQIHKVFKGNLDRGTVQLIGHSSNVYISHGGYNINLPDGYTGIFFCKISDFPEPPIHMSTGVTNEVKLSFINNVAYLLSYNPDYPEALFDKLLFKQGKFDNLKTILSWYEFLDSQQDCKLVDYTEKTFKQAPPPEYISRPALPPQRDELKVE